MQRRVAQWKMRVDPSLEESESRCWVADEMKWDWQVLIWLDDEQLSSHWDTVWLTHGRLTSVERNVDLHTEGKETHELEDQKPARLFFFFQGQKINSGRVCFLCSTMEWLWYCFYSIINPALLCAYFSLVVWKRHWKALDVRFDRLTQTSPTHGDISRL